MWMWILGFCQRFCTASFLKNPEEERETQNKRIGFSRVEESEKAQIPAFLIGETCPILFVNKDGSAIGMATEAWLLAEAERRLMPFFFYACFGRITDQKRSNCSDLANTPVICFILVPELISHDFPIYGLQLFCVNNMIVEVSAANVYRQTGSDRYRTDGVH